MNEKPDYVPGLHRCRCPYCSRWQYSDTCGEWECDSCGREIYGIDEDKPETRKKPYKMSIEKYKLKLEAAIYECCDKYYIGGKIVEEVLREYYVDQLNLSPDLPAVSKSVCDCFIPATDFNRKFCFKCKAPLTKNGL